MRDGSPAERGRTFPLVMAIILGLLGLWVGGFGAYLAALGGSLYYLLAGLTLLATAVLLYRRKSAALAVYAALLVLTILWALWEVGLDFWQLAPRGDLLVPLAHRPAAAVADPVAAPGDQRAARIRAGAVGRRVGLARRGGRRLAAGPARPAGQPACGGGRVGAPHLCRGARRLAGLCGDLGRPQMVAADRDQSGQRRQAQVAWQFHTGDLKRPDDPGEFTYEMTPIKVGNLLYLCTPHDIVIALDPASGQQRWRFDPKVSGQAGRSI